MDVINTPFLRNLEFLRHITKVLFAFFILILFMGGASQGQAKCVVSDQFEFRAGKQIQLSSSLSYSKEICKNVRCHSVHKNCTLFLQIVFKMFINIYICRANK